MVYYVTGIAPLFYKDYIEKLEACFVKYTDEAYKEAIAVVVSDIHYSNASYTSKIANIRRYSEIIIRRLLGYDTEKQLTLGHHVTQDKLRKKGFTEKLLIDAVTSINEDGSDRTHTQVIPIATKEEYEKAVSNLFDLYAYLFVVYFKRNPFGSNHEIMKAFSILPAEIRCSALLCLYDLYPDNIYIIDKLVLAMVKARGLAAADAWIQDFYDKKKIMSMGAKALRLMKANGRPDQNWNGGRDRPSFPVLNLDFGGTLPTRAMMLTTLLIIFLTYVSVARTRPLSVRLIGRKLKSAVNTITK